MLHATVRSSLLYKKYIKINIYRAIILPVVLYGCETWSLILREEHRLKVIIYKTNLFNTAFNSQNLAADCCTH